MPTAMFIDKRHINRNSMRDPAASPLRLVTSFSGIRGEYKLSPQITNDGKAIAAVYGYSYGMFNAERLPEGHLRLVLGQDPRPTSDAILRCITMGTLLAAKETKRRFEYINLGVTTTPICEAAVREFSADGGIMGTGSHNQMGHNGWKFFTGRNEPGIDAFLNQNGGILNAGKKRTVIEHARGIMTQISNGDYGFLNRINEMNCAGLGQAFDTQAFSGNAETAFSGYCRHITDYAFRLTLQEQKLFGSGKLVVLDPNGGGGCGLAKRAVETILPAWQVLEINGDIGKPGHRIVPEGTALRQATEECRRTNAEFASVYDFDADRGNNTALGIRLRPQDIALSNVAGMFAWVATHLDRYETEGAHERPWAVVAHDATSNRVNEFCQALRIRFEKVETGEANVITRMHQLEREGYFVPVGIEGYNGGSVLMGSEVRDGTMTAILQMLMLSAPDAFSFIRNKMHLPAWEGGYGIKDIIRSLPRYSTIQKDLICERILNRPFDKKHEEVVRAFESFEENKPVTINGMQFNNLRYYNYREEKIYPGRGNREPEVPCGFEMVFEGPSGILHSIWLRPSKTEKGVFRMRIDSPDRDIANRLYEFAMDRFIEAIRQ